MYRLALATALCWSLSSLTPTTAAEAEGPAEPLVVTTDNGPVAGRAADGVASFLGIPYAAPPVGELRWRPPRPVEPWSEPRDAHEYKGDCMQLPFPGDAAPLRTTPAEDCLYLNVWTPAKRGPEALPVMVWIHGGGFVNGGTSPAVYDGSAFARRGVVLVSMNYRLGRFGFFAHPALSRKHPDEPHGNYGFLDQVEALRWVARNAAAFGGDPENVTIFGESAGGASVNTLMTSPLARGLFHKAIVESGGGRGIAATKHLPEAEALGLAFAKKNGIEGDDAAALRALRRLDAQKLVNGMNLLAQQPDTYSGPMIDGTVVVSTVEAAFREGRQAKVPYMIGANDREFGFFLMPAVETDKLLAEFGDDRDAVLLAYDPEGKLGKGEVGVQLASDRIMVEPARLLARLASSHQPTFSYRFSYVAQTERASQPGALHASEIPFAFATIRAKLGDKTAPEDEAMAEAMNAYWAAFAGSGDPNGGGRPSWPAYTAQDDMIMDFTAGGPVAGPDPRAVRLDFVERQAEAPASDAPAHQDEPGREE